MKQLSFVKACMEYFGRKPDQTAGQFAIELKSLTEADRQYFSREFLKVGIEIVPPGLEA